MGAFKDARISFYRLDGRWGYNIQLGGRGTMRAAQFYTKAGAWVSAWFAAQRLKTPFNWAPKQD